MGYMLPEFGVKETPFKELGDTMSSDPYGSSIGGDFRVPGEGKCMRLLEFRGHKPVENLKDPSCAKLG